MSNQDRLLSDELDKLFYDDNHTKTYNPSGKPTGIIMTDFDILDCKQSIIELINTQKRLAIDNFKEIVKLSNTYALEEGTKFYREDNVDGIVDEVIGSDDEMHQITPSIPNVEMVNMIRENNYIAGKCNELRKEQRQRYQSLKNKGKE